MNFFAVYVFLCAVLGLSSSQFLCPDNEEVVECVNPCNNCNAKGQCVNDAECKSGCDCISGTRRNSAGQCVREEYCDAQNSNPSPSNGGPCKPDEEYYDSCTPSCKNTCQTYNNPGVRCACAPPSCFCRQGLVQAENKTCIPPEQCPGTKDVPKKCGKNEQYSSCVVPCNDCYTKGNCEFFACNAGCDCKEGFYRNEARQCIPEYMCPGEGQCGPNEVFSECGSACPPTCRNRDENQACTLQCVRGCFCRKGFVKTENGHCVRPENCNQGQCGPNEVFSECGSACPPTCRNRGENQACTLQCVRGCFCRKGFVKGENGQCVRPENCNQGSCIRRGEVFLECGSACPLTCENNRENQLCSTRCVRGCFCRDGLVRSKDGECVRPEDCRICGPDEEYQECGSACPPTCDYRSANSFCTLQCVSGCFCKRGLVRRQYDGKCVRRENCYPGWPFLRG